MEQLSWVFLGVVAMVVSAGAVGLRSIPQHVAQIATGFSIFLWGYWAISATDVYIAATDVTHSYTGAMLLGLAAALIMALLLVESIFALFGIADSGGPKNAI